MEDFWKGLFKVSLCVPLKTKFATMCEIFFFDNSCLFSTNKEKCTHVYVLCSTYINFKDHLVDLETESDFVHFGSSK